MNNQDILDIAENAYHKFKNMHSYIVEPVFLMISERKFRKYLKYTPLQSDYRYTPSFVAHLPDGELVCLCKKTINRLIKKYDIDNPRIFIEAIIYHEIFHIINHWNIFSYNDAIKSEKEVHKELVDNYPMHAKMLDMIGRKIYKNED